MQKKFGIPCKVAKLRPKLLHRRSRRSLWLLRPPLLPQLQRPWLRSPQRLLRQLLWHLLPPPLLLCRRPRRNLLLRSCPPLLLRLRPRNLQLPLLPHRWLLNL